MPPLAFSKQLQRTLQKYLEEGHSPHFTMQQVAEWGIQRGEWEARHEDLVNLYARQLARAAREVHYTDPQGRSVRTFHAAKEESPDGDQLTFWELIFTASRSHMETSFQQRRQGIVGDVKQLKTDVDSYNENQNPGPPIQFVLDFTYDVEELEAVS